LYENRAPLARLGGGILSVIDYTGEYLADMLGITESKYQYVLDAHNREIRMQQMEEQQEIEAKNKLENKRSIEDTMENGGLTTANTNLTNDQYINNNNNTAVKDTVNQSNNNVNKGRASKESKDSRNEEEVHSINDWLDEENDIGNIDNKTKVILTPNNRSMADTTNTNTNISPNHTIQLA
jgi:hypothetical protein